MTLCLASSLRIDSIGFWYLTYFLGLHLHHLYAQTETTFSVGFKDGEEAEPGSMGRGMYGYRIGILDKSGIELEAGDNGILAINLNPPPYGLFLGWT